jgi:hypothetical protein
MVQLVWIAAKPQEALLKLQNSTLAVLNEHLKERCSTVSSSPLQRGQLKSFQMLKYFLLRMFQVFNLTAIRNHANTYCFGQSLDFQIHREEEFIKLH